MAVRAKASHSNETKGLIVFATIWTLFSLPFAFIFPPVGLIFTGVGILLFCVGLAPALRATKLTHPEVTLSSDLLRLGDPFTFRLQQIFKGDLNVDSVTVQFMMRESATYTRGTDTYTDTHEKIQREVSLPGRTYRAGEILTIEETFQVPLDGMHTFRANKNKIEWLVKVDIRIARWPDVKEEYPVMVLAERVKQ